MKKIGLSLGLLFIVLLGFWAWIFWGFGQTSQSQVFQKTLAEQTDDQGEVVVQVTPLKLRLGQEAKFTVALNTHSMDLNYDLLKVSSLIDDRGNSLKPLSWDGGSGGHHLRGELIFPNISSRARSVELKILGISGFDRSFKWKLS